MDEQRYMYTVSPRRPIRGLVRGKVIIKPTNLSLTKDEVKMCMRYGSVTRKFYLDPNLEKVTPSNLDRLHRKEHLTEDQYKKIVEYELSKKELDLDVSSNLIPEEEEVEVKEDAPTMEPIEETENLGTFEEEPIGESESIEEEEEPSEVDLKKAEEEQSTVESEPEKVEEVQEEETVEEEPVVEIPQDLTATTETKKKSSRSNRRKKSNSRSNKTTEDADSQE